MKRLFWLLIVLCVLLVCGAVAAYSYFGIAGVAAVIVVLIASMFGLKRLAAYALEKVITGAIRSKGDALKGARVEVHAVRPAPAPVLDEEHDDSDARADREARHWYYIELTITPQQASDQAFKMWEPGELIFVSPDALADDIEADIDDPLGELHDYQVWNGSEFIADELGKHEGVQRLKLHAGILRGTTRVQLRYYFCLLGEIALPKPPHSQGTAYTNGSTHYPPH